MQGCVGAIPQSGNLKVTLPLKLLAVLGRVVANTRQVTAEPLGSSLNEHIGVEGAKVASGLALLFSPSSLTFQR